MAEEVFDVAIQSTGFYLADYLDWQDTPPPIGDFPLGPDCWIGRLPHGLTSAAVFDACDPPGFKFNPVRQYGGRYAFCRKVEPNTSLFYEWDSDGLLGRTLFLSRLIHPTTIATHASARLFFEDGQLTMIVPGRVQGYGTYVWIVANEWRDWLSKSEAEQLRDYIPRNLLKNDFQRLIQGANE